MRPSRLAMQEISVRARSMAIPGDVIWSSSRCQIAGLRSLSSFLSGRMRRIRFPKKDVHGRNKRASPTLKTVWALATWRAAPDWYFSARNLIRSANCGIQKKNSATPASLKKIWARATRLASREVPMLERAAVIQVPRLAPKIIGIPASIVIRFCWARTIRIPVKALLL